MEKVGPKKRIRPNRRRETKKLRPEAQPRTRRQRTLLILKWVGIAFLAASALCAAVVALLFWHYGRDPSLPSITSLGDYHPKQVTRIETEDGDVIGEIFTERRSFVPYDQIPEVMVQAVISAEDAKFFEHKGIDYLGMVRALFVNLRSGKKKQGASTITQQVVKTFLLSPERTFKRKFQEIILARRLENRLTKEEILTLYLNQIYLGGGRYGVQEAARYYFGKDVKDLNAGEAALIAGLPQSPEHITPKKPQNSERAKARQKYVLEQMAYHGYISEEEARKWINEPIRIVADPFPKMGAAPEWVDLVRRELVERYGNDSLDKLGATVVTTMDLELQKIASDALRAGLRAVDKRRKFGRSRRKVRKNKIDLELAKLARRLPDSGPEVGKSYEAVVLEVHDSPPELVVDLGKWKASVLLGTDADERFNPEGKKPGERFAVGDVVRVVLPSEREAEGQDAGAATRTGSAGRTVELAPGPQGAVVIIDPRTRQVLALVGGYENRVADFDRATMAKRQPGSAFKPFVYATAVDTGDFTAASIVNDAPEVYDLWKPQNYKKGEFEGPVRLRYALAKSINTVAIRVLHDIGPERVAELAHEMGISSQLPTTLSLALGSGEVTPLELTNAFATFAAGGRAAPPRVIRSIAGEEPPPVETHEVLRPEVAYVLVDMMRSVVEEGTGRRARGLRLNIAGKTGTSNDARDAWFLGMTPDLVIGVWVGFDDNTPLGHREGGSRTALPVFVDIMTALRERTPPIRSKEFPRPPGIVEARIDKATGLLAADGADPSASYDEVFIEGTAPTETAPAPGEVDAASVVFDEYDDAAYDDTSGTGDEDTSTDDEP